MTMFKHISRIVNVAAALLCLSCTRAQDSIPVITWGGVPAECSEEVFPILKECGIDAHLGFYKTDAEALKALDIANKNELKLIPGLPALRDSAQRSASRLKDHPALLAWNIKDEPEIWDFHWITQLVNLMKELDPVHPSYVNLYPNWAWDENLYAERIENFASEVDLPFYSFDQYPITENEDGNLSIREGWYRNLEEFSEMARRHDKPFWAFALTTSHHIGAPSPEAFYPVPGIGQLRLQVFSNLLYGAQAIQYFTAKGLYDTDNHCRTSVFGIVKQVNEEIRAYSPVFLGCKVSDVQHIGCTIPKGTKSFTLKDHKFIKKLEISGEGGVVSFLNNGGREYVAIQNRDCVNPALLEIGFSMNVRRITPEGSLRFDGKAIKMEPGDMVVFKIN